MLLITSILHSSFTDKEKLDNFCDYAADQVILEKLNKGTLDEDFFKKLELAEEYEWVKDEELEEEKRKGKRKRKLTAVMAESLCQEDEKENKKNNDQANKKIKKKHKNNTDKADKNSMIIAEVSASVAVEEDISHVPKGFLTQFRIPFTPSHMLPNPSIANSPLQPTAHPLSDTSVNRYPLPTVNQQFQTPPKALLKNPENNTPHNIYHQVKKHHR